TATHTQHRPARGVASPPLAHVLEAANALVPSLRREHAIKTFAANRPASDPVYRVGRASTVENLVHAPGIRSTGVSSSPATAELVRSLVAELVPEAGEDRPDAVRELEPLPRLLWNDHPEALL